VPSVKGVNNPRCETTTPFAREIRTGLARMATYFAQWAATWPGLAGQRQGPGDEATAAHRTISEYDDDIDAGAVDIPPRDPPRSNRQCPL
jgi:hypothetical protein